MIQAVNRRLLTMEAWHQFQVRKFMICGGRTGNGIGFSGSTSIFPSDYHSNNAQCRKSTGLLEHYSCQFLGMETSFMC
jgi:hypothetical protein